MGEIPRPLLSFLSPRLGSCSPPRAAARTGLDEVPSTTCTPSHPRSAALPPCLLNSCYCIQKVYRTDTNTHTRRIDNLQRYLRKIVPAAARLPFPIPFRLIGQDGSCWLLIPSGLTSRFALSPKLPELKATTSSHRVGCSPCFLPCVVWFRTAYLPLVPWSAIVVFIFPCRLLARHARGRTSRPWP